MSNIKVTRKQIDDLIAKATVNISTIFDKCTVVTVQLENGFILTESSACVDPANYNQNMGAQICLERIQNKLWELEGYALQKRVHEGFQVPILVGSFGWAIEVMKNGYKVRRRGWNGKGIYIELQRPDANSKMTSPYIYIDTTGLQTDNPDAPKSCVPWLASQTDMLAEDWELAE